jgi:hypothetical protein
LRGRCTAVEGVELRIEVREDTKNAIAAISVLAGYFLCVIVLPLLLAVLAILALVKYLGE